MKTYWRRGNEIYVILLQNNTLNIEDDETTLDRSDFVSDGWIQLSLVQAIYKILRPASIKLI